MEADQAGQMPRIRTCPVEMEGNVLRPERVQSQLAGETERYLATGRERIGNLHSEPATNLLKQIDPVCGKFQHPRCRGGRLMVEQF